MITKPPAAHAPDYCRYYFDLVQSGNLLQELRTARKNTLNLMNAIPVRKANQAYAPGKWTIKEVFRHIIDCERVYAYRAFRFSRFDKTELPGFEEDAYIFAVKGMDYSMSKLRDEYLYVRNSTISLFEKMSGKMLDFKGHANGVVFTARALGYMAVGHNLHHCAVIRSRYL